MNKLLGLLLIINGLWMIKEEKVGYDYYGIYEVHGIMLYIYTSPLIFLGIYFLFSKAGNEKDDDNS